MKKIIATLLAGACVASMGVTAFASNSNPTTAGDMSYTLGTSDFGSFVYTDKDKSAVDSEFTPTDEIFVKLTGSNITMTGTQAGNENEINNLAAAFNDDDLFKFKKEKGDDDTKIIKSMAYKEKDINSSAPGREFSLYVELNNDYTDKDFKISPEFTFTAKKDLNTSFKEAKTGDTIAVKAGTKYYFTFTAHVSNTTEKTDDRDFVAGTDGIIVKPVKDEENTITWEDENNDIAMLKFNADSDVSKYFPKLSTKWDNADYEENFAGTDAYIFNFVSNPTISSTARPVLTIYNPFYDSDNDELTVAPEDTYVYEIVDGVPVDVTDKWTAGENEDGDAVFTIKTRTLGTYIFSAAPIAGEEEEVEPTEPETTPTEETGKVNPGTGRF